MKWVAVWYTVIAFGAAVLFLRRGETWILIVAVIAAFLAMCCRMLWWEEE